MGIENRLKCEACGEPLAACACYPGDRGDPLAGDLTTDDLVEFRLVGHPGRPEIVVPEDGDWRAVLLSWMFDRGDYPNVWLRRDDAYFPIGLAEDEDDDEGEDD